MATGSGKPREQWAPLAKALAGPFEHLITVEHCLRSWKDEPDNFNAIVRMTFEQTADIIDEMRAHLRDFGRHSPGCCYEFGYGCKCGWHEVCLDLGFDDPIRTTEGA